MDELMIVGRVFSDMQSLSIGSLELREEGLFVTTTSDFVACMGRLCRDCLGYSVVGAAGQDLLRLKQLGCGAGLIETPDGANRCLIQEEAWEKINAICDQFLP